MTTQARGPLGAPVTTSHQGDEMNVRAQTRQDTVGATVPTSQLPTPLHQADALETLRVLPRRQPGLVRPTGLCPRVGGWEQVSPIGSPQVTARGKATRDSGARVLLLLRGSGRNRSLWERNPFPSFRPGRQACLLWGGRGSSSAISLPNFPLGVGDRCGRLSGVAKPIFRMQSKVTLI